MVLQVSAVCLNYVVHPYGSAGVSCMLELRRASVWFCRCQLYALTASCLRMVLQVSAVCLNYVVHPYGSAGVSCMLELRRASV